MATACRGRLLYKKNSVNHRDNIGNKKENKNNRRFKVWHYSTANIKTGPTPSYSSINSLAMYS